jgi:hypothetical protein
MGNITSLFTTKSSAITDINNPVAETTPPVAETTPIEECTTKIPFYNQMDDNNKTAVEVWANEGVDKAIQHMFEHPETGAPMDYGTMRYYYG